MNKIIIILEAEKEDETPRQAERRAGFAPGFTEDVKKVQDVADGRWGWCSVKLTVKLPNGKEGVDYLGGCSYASAVDFINSSSYFNDMVKAACREAGYEPALLPAAVDPAAD